MELTSYAELAVRLVNTERALRGRDMLTSVEELQQLIAEKKAWQRRVCEQDVAELRALRARLRQVFSAVAAGQGRAAVDELNALLNEYPVHPQVSGHDDRDWHLHLAEGAPTVAAGYAAGACMGLAVQLTQLGIDRLGVCQAAPCADVFIDTSTNRSRRYCSDRCATRANVAAYRARRREQEVRGAPGGPASAGIAAPAPRPH
jgi:predicted RNA-binding Zn ribbon-like protein